MVGRIEVDVIGPDHDDVRFFAWRERAAFIEKTGAGGAACRCALEYLSHADERRRLRVAIDLAICGHRTLYVEGDTHLTQHVGAVRYFVVDAEAGPHAVVERFLKCRNALAERVL